MVGMVEGEGEGEGGGGGGGVDVDGEGVCTLFTGGGAERVRNRNRVRGCICWDVDPGVMERPGRGEPVETLDGRTNAKLGEERTGVDWVNMEVFFRGVDLDVWERVRGVAGEVGERVMLVGVLFVVLRGESGRLRGGETVAFVRDLDQIGAYPNDRHRSSYGCSLSSFCKMRTSRCNSARTSWFNIVCIVKCERARAAWPNCPICMNFRTVGAEMHTASNCVSIIWIILFLYRERNILVPSFV